MKDFKPPPYLPPSSSSSSSSHPSASLENHSCQKPEFHSIMNNLPLHQTQENHYLPTPIPDFHPMSSFTNTPENNYLPNPIPEYHYPMSSFTDPQVENHYIQNLMSENHYPMSSYTSTRENHYIPNLIPEYHPISSFTSTQENDDLLRRFDLGATQGSGYVIPESRNFFPGLNQNDVVVSNTGGFCFPEPKYDINLDFLSPPENNLGFGGNSCFPGSLESAFNRLNISPPAPPRQYPSSPSVYTNTDRSSTIRIGSYKDPFDPNNYYAQQQQKQADMMRMKKELERLDFDYRFNRNLLINDLYVNKNSSNYRLTNNRYRNSGRGTKICMSMEQAMGNIAVLAKTREGCDFLKAELNKKENADLIIRELTDEDDKICEIMVHQIGHALVEPLFIVCNDAQINRIIMSVFRTKEKLESICLDMHGSRAIQRLLNYVIGNQIGLILSVMEGVTVRVAKGVHGRHVIDCCLEKFNFQDTKGMMLEIADNYFELGLDSNGCCVLQKCITRAKDDLKDRLVDDITANAVEFSKNPYGNYVVQKILLDKKGKALDEFVEKLEGEYMSLASDKFGSNVVEKFFHVCTDHQISRIICELMYHPNFLELMQSDFGNYVVQSALNKSKGDVRQELLKFIWGHRASIQTNPFGSWVWRRTERELRRR